VVVQQLLTSSCLTDMTLSSASCDSELAPVVAMTTSSSNDSVTEVTAGLVGLVVIERRQLLLVRMSKNWYYKNRCITLELPR